MKVVALGALVLAVVSGWVALLLGVATPHQDASLLGTTLVLLVVVCAGLSQRSERVGERTPAGASATARDADPPDVTFL
jgi:hypothetical protein